MYNRYQSTKESQLGRSEFISLYDYLGKRAGSELGKQVFKYAGLIKAPYGTKQVLNSSYKNGTIMTYPKEFLVEFFAVKKFFENK